MNAFGILFQLKLALLKNAAARLFQKSKLEFATFIFFFIFAGAGLFMFFFASFSFFSRQEPFGTILIDETFYLFNFALFSMLLISSGVSAYASLYRSREVPFLLTRPLTWSDIYFIKLVEAMWFSSWSVLFVTLPFMTAYGLNKNLNPIVFPLLSISFYLLMVMIAASLGTLAAVLTTYLLPTKNHRRAALVLVIILLVSIFMKAQPGALKEQGSIAGVLAGYLPNVEFSKHPALPSFWLSEAILAISPSGPRSVFDPRQSLFYFLLLLANTLFFLTLPSVSVGARLYPYTFYKSQDNADAGRSRRLGLSRFFERILDRFPWPSKPALAFLEKDVKQFLRDPSEWSQLIIFFGLLLFYFLNLRNLNFHVLKDFWRTLVFVLNTVGTYVVLSSFSMRFVFPMLSLEGSKSWIIGLAPIRYSSLLLEKFLLGGTLSAALTLPLIFLSGWMLEIPLRQIFFTTGMGVFVCAALTGLSAGLGAKFINFRSNNPAEIISGFGGSMLLVTHLSYLAFVGAFLMLSRQSNSLAFLTAGAVSLLVCAVPLKIGVRTLQRMEF